MNRIILIGNGFDLAHGLKTRYYDFINDYWERKVYNIVNSFKRGSLIGIKQNSYQLTYEYQQDNDILLKNILRKSVYQTIENLKEKYGYDKMLEFINYLRDYNNVDFIITNSFLERISDIQRTQKWVDVEEEYYLALLECNKNIDEIKKLNNDFSTIQNALEKYLHDEYEKKEKEKEIKVIPKLDNILKSDILEKDIPSLNCDEKPNKILYLNFNYTYTLNNYQLNKENSQFIYIHGELNSENNPVIFGYGDDIGKQYKDIEKINKNDFLLNMKSIKYSKNNNYKNMIAFANADDYQIYILGHSCGVSDRTLLNTLFEHERCKSIKIFYHINEKGENNYLDTFINLSRNFNNKARMREIVASQENSETMV